MQLSDLMVYFHGMKSPCFQYLLLLDIHWLAISIFLIFPVGVNFILYLIMLRNKPMSSWTLSTKSVTDPHHNPSFKIYIIIYKKNKIWVEIFIYCVVIHNGYNLWLVIVFLLKPRQFKKNSIYRNCTMSCTLTNDVFISGIPNWKLVSKWKILKLREQTVIKRTESRHYALDWINWKWCHIDFILSQHLIYYCIWIIFLLLLLTKT